MAENPITVSLPADLPEDWAENDIVAPNGADAGLTEQHGYNYLMEQVNAAQTAATQVGAAFVNLPSLGEDGKIPADELPDGLLTATVQVTYNGGES